jgi:integrase
MQEASSHSLPSARRGAVKLTQASVQKLELPRGKTDAIFWDDDVAGFGLRLREGGAKVWVVQYTLGTKQRRMTLGSAKALDAGKARQTAKDLLAAVRLGHDPAAERAEARVKASDEEFSEVVERFLVRQRARLRPRSFHDTQRYLRELWKPLHRLHLPRISRKDVAAWLDTIANENGLITADRARAALSAFFGWALREGLCEVNPVLATNKAAELKSRERVLSDEELRNLWGALPDSDYGRIVKLLALTGQRREEIGGLRWSEIDWDECTITLPGERTKNHRPHVVPLSELALAILKAQPQRAGRDLVFGDGPRSGTRSEGREGGGFQGWSKAKTALDELVPTIGDWRLHDLRRTVATRMADELKVQPHIIEAVLNHISGHKAGVAGVYNRAIYLEEKASVLTLWADRLEQVVSGKIKLSSHVATFSLVP